MRILKILGTKPTTIKNAYSKEQLYNISGQHFHNAYEVLTNAINNTPAKDLYKVLETFKDVQGQITDTKDAHDLLVHAIDKAPTEHLQKVLEALKDLPDKITYPKYAHKVLSDATQKAPAKNLFQVLEILKNLIQIIPTEHIMILKNEVKSKLQGQEPCLQKCLDILDGKSKDNSSIGKHVGNETENNTSYLIR